MADRFRSAATSPHGWRLASFFKLIALAIVAALIALGVAVAIAWASLPSYDELVKAKPQGQTILVHAADGSTLVSLGPSYGEWLPSGRIPDVMKDAMISVEDRRFYSHVGIDPIGIARSVWVARRLHDEGHRLQGASTITQQLARNIFLTNAYSFGRKFREIILALAMERKFSKQQILELYLNRVYFGGGAYGIDAASERFFGHSADRLSLAEAAIVAGLVKAPSNYSPTADAQAAIGRGKVVIETMQDAGRITPVQARDADIDDVHIAPQPKQNSVRYFTDWALQQLDTLVDQTTETIQVWTTLDPKLQRAADDAIRADTPPGSQGALVAIDQDGAVRAMVGGRDYVTSIYNRATQAVRQPGSSFKLFVYLAALEAGHHPGDTIVDEPITIDGWSPRNDSGHFSGPVSLRTAFAYSMNTVAAKLGQQSGFDTVADMARRFGISTPVNTHPSMVLGTSDVRLIDMTRAFASVGNKGVAVTPYAIVKVTSQSGEMLYEHQDPSPRVLVSPGVAAEMTDLLQTAVATGTGRAAQLDRPVAGKTGTTTSNKDGWFLGFASGLTTGVWIGRDDARPVPGLSGGHAPAQTFHDFMKIAVAKRPVEKFDSELTLPDQAEEPDDEAYYGDPDNGDQPPAVDENGEPIGGDAAPPADAPDEVTTTSPPTASSRAPAIPPRGADGQIDQQWLDSVLNHDHGAKPRASGGSTAPRD